MLSTHRVRTCNSRTKLLEYVLPAGHLGLPLYIVLVNSKSLKIEAEEVAQVLPRPIRLATSRYLEVIQPSCNSKRHGRRPNISNKFPNHPSTKIFLMKIQSFQPKRHHTYHSEITKSSLGAPPAPLYRTYSKSPVPFSLLPITTSPTEIQMLYTHTKPAKLPIASPLYLCLANAPHHPLHSAINIPETLHIHRHRGWRQGLCVILLGSHQGDGKGSRLAP